MKKTLKAIVGCAALFMIFIAGCSSGQAAATESAGNPSETAAETETVQQQESYTVGIFIKDSTTAFWRYVADAAKAAGEELGAEVIEYAPASYTDSAGQLSQVEDAIQAGVDAICIAAIDSTAIAPALQEAHEAGIAVLTFNTLVPDFENEISFVGVDNYEVSRIITQQLMEDHNYEGNLIVLEGDPATFNNQERTRPVYELAEEHEGITILTTQPTYANREQGMTVMENLLQTYDDIDMVWNINDVSALGAIQAIEGAGAEGIDVIGIDGTPEACVAVLQGRMKYTVDQSPKEQGALAIQTAVAYLNGETVEENIPTGGTLIGIDNAETFLQEIYPEYEY